MVFLPCGRQRKSTIKSASGWDEDRSQCDVGDGGHAAVRKYGVGLKMSHQSSENWLKARMIIYLSMGKMSWLTEHKCTYNTHLTYNEGQKLFFCAWEYIFGCLKWAPNLKLQEIYKSLSCSALQNSVIHSPRWEDWIIQNRIIQSSHLYVHQLHCWNCRTSKVASAMP